MSDTTPTETRTTDGESIPLSDRGRSPAGESRSDDAPASPPGPRGLPVIGNTLSFARDPLDFLDSIGEYGDIVGYEAFGRDLVAVFDPAVVEAVLVSRNDEFWRGEFEGEFGDLIGIEGVVFADGECWRRQRRLLQSSFTPDRVRSYAADVVDETAQMADGWADGEVVDVREALSTLTLRVLTRSLFDVEIGGEEPRSSGTASGPRPRAGDRADLVRAWTDAMRRYIDAELFGARAVLPAWLPSRTKREFDRATADVSDLVDDLVAERRRSGADGDDLLSILATAEYPDGSRLSPEEIRDQLLTFLLAGHETTATALTYTWWLLAGDEDARRDLDRDVEAVCGDRDPTAAELPDLSVAEAACREAMRLYPPFPFVHREPHAACTLGGYRIEPGTTVQLAMSSIHRDDRWWTDPGSFRPERWLDADGSIADGGDRPEYAYFPFGGGPRHCLGMRFAMTELKLSLAAMTRRVAFERVTESIDPTVKISLDPGPVELRVRKR
ncbi:cytochrome P450 [Halosolutus gelatinilyticus]|uniref:cytochrome P450 n=1 Tax=Halosolutus gelatinilyticus TaxID=2931975 RepID=UPI001FF2E9B1|nr:cytochrome P450 [Halosolutus gelatinilyticus]